VHDPWREAYSWRSADRPVFEEILAFIDAHPGEVQYYIFRTIDRFTRAGSLTYQEMQRALEKRGVELIDTYGIIQPSINTLEHLGVEFVWSRTRPSKVAEIVEAEKANQEITTILTRLIGQEIALRRRGYKVRSPNDGFVNTRIEVGNRKHVIETPDPERAKYFVAMFEMRASGGLSDQEICDRLNAMGYRSRFQRRWDATREVVVGRQGGNPLSPKRLQEIIKRPIYCGVVCERWTNWKPIRAAYDGLVSIETFNAANRGTIYLRETDQGLELLKHYDERRALKLSKNNPQFPFRKVVLCPHCHKAFYGSCPRGRSGQRFPTYHCARGHDYFGVSKREFEQEIEVCLAAAKFDTASRPAIRARVMELFAAQCERARSAVRDISRRQEQIALQKAEIVRAFPLATSDAMRRGLEQQMDALDVEAEKVVDVSNDLDITQEEIEAFLAEATEILEHPALLLKEQANPLPFQALYNFVFEDLPTYEEIQSRTPKWDWFFSLSSASETKESVLVRLRGLDWNHIEKSIRKWKVLRYLVAPLLNTDAGSNVPNVPTSPAASMLATNAESDHCSS